MKDLNEEKENSKPISESYQAEDFFEEIGEYLDEIARGELLTADKEENGVIQMMFYTDDDEKLAEGKTAKQTVKESGKHKGQQSQTE